MKPTYYNRKTHELNDRKIVEDLRKAADLYEEGSIVEADDLIAAIHASIVDFDREERRRGT